MIILKKSHQAKILMSNPELELAHGLDKGGALNIPDSSAEFNDANIGHLIGLISGKECNPFNPFLDRVGHVGHNLNGLAEVISPALESERRRKKKKEEEDEPRISH